jgi:hypothetical protein
MDKKLKGNRYRFQGNWIKISREMDKEFKGNA